MPLVKVASLNDIKSGHTKIVSIGGEEIALYNVSGQIYATSNECPHKGGPVGEGELAGEIITCPWHGWQFNVKTGENVFTPASRIRTFHVVVQDGDIMVDVS